MPRSESNSERSRSRSPRGDRNPHQEEEKVSSSNDNCCLYIGSIDKRVTDEKLKELFEKQGEMEYCFIVYEPQSAAERGSKTEIKQSRGYGFAKYHSKEDAASAVEKLNGYDLNGRKLNIEFSKRPNAREKTPGRYLGKKRPSPPRHSSKYRRSYSRSSSGSHRRRKHSQKRSRKYDRYEPSRSRSRDDSERRHRRRSSYSRSPRR